MVRTDAVPADRIKLVISDMDGTLLAPDKGLSTATRQAVQRLNQAGIGFTVISSRPPRGMQAAVAQLDIRLPFAAFNGGSLLAPDRTLLAAHRLSADAARRAIAVLQDAGVGTWVFAADQWRLTDPAGFRVARERNTVGFEPIVVADFDAVIGHVDKIMGVSDDPARLQALEARVHAALGDQAQADCSNAYYLDITHPEANKGAGVRALCAQIGIPLAQTAVIGDMTNDVAMFRVGGLAIAMGQAPAWVRDAAHATTLSNAEDGFAAAVERLILPVP